MKTKNNKRYMAVLLALALTLGSVSVFVQPDMADAASKKAVLKLKKTKVSVKQGSKVKLKIVQKNIKKIKSQKWSSANKKIATVNKKGTVSGKKAGKSTTITCKLKYVTRSSNKTKSKTLKCKVTVKKKGTDAKATQTPSASQAPAKPSNAPQPPAASQTPVASPGIPEEKSNGQLYHAAVVDSMEASEDEICPLVSLTKDDKLVTWDDQGRVLLCTWHNYPDSYPKGEKVTINWGYVWTFTDKEIASNADELKTAKDPEMRMKQLIGFEPDSKHSTVTAFWVKPEDVLRPAYQSNATLGSMSTSFAEDEDADSEFRQWFDENILSSYYYGAYPWTRLGYTYDWADNGKEYGMTEFIVNPGSEVEVEFTETTEEFLKRLTNG